MGLSENILEFSSHPIGFHFNLNTHREGQLKQLSLVISPPRAINHAAAREEKKRRDEKFGLPCLIHPKYVCALGGSGGSCWKG